MQSEDIELWMILVGSAGLSVVVAGSAFCARRYCRDGNSPISDVQDCLLLLSPSCLIRAYRRCCETRPQAAQPVESALGVRVPVPGYMPPFQCL